MSAGLTRGQVVAVYRQVLGRAPREDEIAHQLATLPSIDAMIRIALDSDEYAAQRAAADRPEPRAPNLVNIFHPDLATWGHPVGRRSGDGDAIVGDDGWLFLCGGTNANLGQYVGAVQMEAGWDVEWQAVMSRREAEIRTLGVAAATVVVPDKLAVYEERYPEPLTRVGPRPVERLLAAGDLPICYPLKQLRDGARDEHVFLRTDTHLTFRGNHLLFESVRAALGVEVPLDLSEVAVRPYVAAGDLGVKFTPSIVEVISAPNTFHRARIAEDNRAEIAAAGGHIGTRRVLVNDTAPDERVVVLFGDSFGFGAEHYQGLAWFLAQVFRETHFVWIPFGWDPAYVRTAGAGAVVIEGAERFIARVPAPSVDVEQLAEQTLGRRPSP